MAVYDQVRKRLQKESGNEWAVTWEDVAEEGQMELRKRKLLKRSEHDPRTYNNETGLLAMRGPAQ